ncbi:hypothetical protein BDV25DRAFT_162288 [Aspergillus avenaceus]|uniref:BHLH domain-containing protein n=1 Tax=Aspergillus avenaceus TaxID=36643 RepID=A0A5N6TJJ0_ASPAV|nr:hypothetical protein BDV25DRAFT_162288 [Aspergillus avenaceus]
MQDKMSYSSEPPHDPQFQDLSLTWNDMIGLDNDLEPMATYGSAVEPSQASLRKRPNSPANLDYVACYVPQYPSSFDLLSWEAYDDWASLEDTLAFSDHSQMKSSPRRDYISNSSELSAEALSHHSHRSSMSPVASLSPPPCSLSESPRSSSHDGVCQPSTRRSAHNRIEKRYRENLSKNFASLESALQCYYNPGGASKKSRFCCQRKHASKKMAILTDATNYIGELEAETVLLKKKLETLRQALLPNGIWKYTLNDN